MFKFIRLTKNICRLGDVPKNITKINHFYCSEAVKQLSTQISGLSADINVQNLTQDDPELLKKLQLIILEIDVMRQEGSRIPESTFLKEQHWQDLISKTTRSQRKKLLEFLWKIEKKKINKVVKREQAKLERDNRPEYIDDGHIRYGLNHNTFFIRIYDTTINHLYNSNLITAMQFGQPLVIDCGFDQSMTPMECKNCAKQIMLAFSDNRIDKEPFDLHLCNANQNSYILKALHRHITTLHEPWFPLHVHSESYLAAKYPSLQNAPQFVYLTPHCREEMQEFDHDAVYIIGGIVDKINQQPLSLAKAKHDNIKMLRLPLDKYLQWGSGSGKSLTINQMVSILLDLKRTGDWNYALRHVPRRKILVGGDGEPEGRRDRFQHQVDRKALRYDKSHSYNKPRNYDKSRTHSRASTKDLLRQLMK